MIALVFFVVFGSVQFYRSKTAIFVSPNGNDQNRGTQTFPVKTIQRGVNLAKPGSVITLLPGIYRETVRISTKNSSFGSITLLAKNSGSERVILTGSEPSSSLDWQICTNTVCPNIQPGARSHTYVGTVDWNEIPTILTEITRDGEHLLTRARSPNIYIENPDKYHEFWWQATTDNATSISTLVDRNHLPFAPNLTGARAYIMDGADRCGTFLYIRSIARHNPQSGSITMDLPVGAVTYGNQETGISDQSKYFVDDAVGLLDNPGEWFFDSSEKKLYLWPIEEKNPAGLSIEIGRRDTGININRSHVTLQGLAIKNINDYDFSDRPTGAIIFAPTADITDIKLKNISGSYLGNGIWAAPPSAVTIQNVKIVNASFRHISKSSISFIGSPTTTDSIRNISITGSDISASGFPSNEPAIYIARSSNVKIDKNSIHSTAGHGIHITGYEKNSMRVQNIRVTENTVEHTCQNSSGCAALKFFGGTFAHSLVAKNTLRDNLGWSFCQEAKGGRDGYANGLFISNASGITVQNNESYRINGAAYLAYARQLPTINNVFKNNLAENSIIGIRLQGAFGESDTDPTADFTRHDNSVVTNNVLKNNHIGLLLDPASPDKVRIANNVYINNRIALSYRSTEITTPSAIPIIFPFWSQ